MRPTPQGARRTGLVLVALVSACSESPDFQPPQTLVYLDQGADWGPRERALFYYTPQGTMLHGLRYSWFQHLEVSEGQRLADPAHLSRFGFLYSPEQFDENFDGGDLNPGNLPVGFAQHRDEVTGEAVVDVSCAACHTGQLEYRGVSLRVDGGQPMHAFAWIKPGQLVGELLVALTTTYVSPLKFDRFAEKVLGTRYPLEKPRLREELRKTIAGFTHEAATTFDKYEDDGYGRLDALGRIADTVFGEDIAASNEKVTDAAVSYPHLWDIWKFDWVQWNGSVAQPMGRNVAESLGVKARLELVDRHGDALPPERMFNSSVLLRELDCIETTLWQLGPPRWPEDIFPAIDLSRAAQGRELFQSHCRGCHGPHVYPEVPEEPVTQPVRYDCDVHPTDRKPTPDKPVEWKLCVVPVWEIGTDPRLVSNYLDSRYDASALDPANPVLASVSAAEALELLMEKVADKKYRQLGIGERERWQMDGWGRRNEMRDMRGYKSRPLHGIWATPPFLHNGSVRTIYQLLSPHAERDEKFWVGSLSYDPVHLGFESLEVQAAFEHDTSAVGNTNTGHQFSNDGGLGVIGPELSPEQRLALIEHLKTLGNPLFDPDYEEYAEPKAGPIRCAPDLQGPAAHPELRWPR